MSAETVTIYVVQVLLASGKWCDAKHGEALSLTDARRIVSESRMTASNIRIVERRVTTIEEVVP